MDLQTLINQAGPPKPAGYSLDPSIQERQWPGSYNVGGLVRPSEPNTIYLGDNQTYSPEDRRFMREHELEHTQQVKAWGDTKPRGTPPTLYNHNRVGMMRQGAKDVLPMLPEAQRESGYAKVGHPSLSEFMADMAAFMRTATPDQYKKFLDSPLMQNPQWRSYIMHYTQPMHSKMMTPENFVPSNPTWTDRYNMFKQKMGF